MRRLCAGLAVLLFGAGAAAEDFTPVVFDEASSPFVIAADERMGAGSVGSVEVGVSIDPGLAPFPETMTLLEQGDGRRTRFALRLVDSGRALAFGDGATMAKVEAPLREGGFFQIAVSTRGERSEVFLDGDLIGTLPSGYGAAGPLPLHIGEDAAVSTPFFGSVHYLRLWSRAAGAAAFRATAAEYARPADPVLAADVAAWSVFTDARQELRFARDWTPEDTLSDGMAGAAAGAPFADIPPAGTRVARIAAWGGERLHALQLVVEDADKAPALLGLRGEPTDAEPDVFELEPGETVAGVEGSFDARSVVQLVILTSRGRRSPPLGAAAPGPTPFSFRVPEGASFDGLIGRDDGRVAAIGLGFLPRRSFGDLSGRWVLRDARSIALMDPPKPGQLHGAYGNRLTLKLHPRNRGTRIRLGANFSWLQADLTLQPDGSWRNANGTAAIRFLGPDEAEFTLLGSTERIVHVRPYEKVGLDGQDFNAISGTFNVELQIPFWETMFQGFDITTLNPENLQEVGPRPQAIFRKPGIGSRDYYVAFQKNVPYGYLHFADFVERSESATQVISSSRDHVESHSDTVGFSIGIPKVFSFGANASFSRSRETHVKEQTQLAFTRDVTVERALVVDEAHIELDPEFRARILALAADLRAGRTPDWERELIRPYGTHYAYAMTVGSLAQTKLTFSSRSYGELASSGRSIGVEASATVKKVKVGASYKREDSLSDAYNDEMSRQFEELSRTGGEGKAAPVFLDLRPLSDLFNPTHFEDETVWAMRAPFKAAIEAYAKGRAPRLDRLEDDWEPYLFRMAGLFAQVAIGGAVGFTFPLAGAPTANFVLAATAQDLCAPGAIFETRDGRLVPSEKGTRAIRQDGFPAAFNIAWRPMTGQLGALPPSLRDGGNVSVTMIPIRMPDADGGMRPLPECPK